MSSSKLYTSTGFDATVANLITCKVILLSASCKRYKGLTAKSGFCSFGNCLENNFVPIHEKICVRRGYFKSAIYFEAFMSITQN